MTLLFPFPRIHPRDRKAHAHTKTHMWLFTAALLLKVKSQKGSNAPIGKWINKTWQIHPVEYYSPINRKNYCNICCNMAKTQNIILNLKKKNSCKRLYTVWFHLCENFKKGNYRDRRQSSAYSWLPVRAGTSCTQDQEGFLRRQKYSKI